MFANEAGAAVEVELGDVDDQLVTAGVVDEPRETGEVKRDDRDADDSPHSRNTISTLTSSHATTHSVHATTLAVIPRVTASASGLAAPPLATTSLAMPHA